MTLTGIERFLLRVLGGGDGDEEGDGVWGVREGSGGGGGEGIAELTRKRTVEQSPTTKKGRHRAS